MGYEHGSRYWDEVVGKNWPAISDGDWRALETIARDAAEAADPIEADRAERLYTDRVRAGVSLELAHEDMRRQRDRLGRLVDALVAAADTFGDMAELVYRTRHKILDVLDRAEDDIRKVNSSASEDDDEEDVERRQRRIEAILEQARREVDEIARAAANAVGPQTLPELRILAELLGRGDPWRRGHGGGGGQGGHDGAGARPRHDGGHPNADPSVPQHPVGHEGERGRSPSDVFARIPLLPDLIRLDPRMMPHGNFDELMRRIGDRLLGMPDRAPVDAPPVDSGPPGAGQALPGPPGSAVSGAPEPGPAVGWAPAGHAAPGAAPSETGTGGADAEPEADTAAGAAHSASHDGPGDHLDGAPDRSERPDRPHSDPATRHIRTPEDDVTAAAVRAAAHDTDSDTDHRANGPVPVAPLIPSPFTGFGGPPAGPVVTGSPPVGAAPTASPGPATSSAAPPENRVSAPTDGRAAAPGPRMPSSAVAGPAAAAPPPVKPPSAGPGADGTGNAMRDAVGGAMLAAAAPGFVLGERVDGDLVLARTLLSSLLAATGAESPGVDAFGVGFAVAVLRHASGISAFVTSNEGRGWLPAGLYLPQEISTPWVWSEAAGSAWEGLADPARVLAEFALAWGSKTGARLTALVSSLPMDEILRAQLGAIPAEGEVTAAAVMDFSRPGAGFVDRLELVGARPLLDRVRDTPPERIAERCLDLARDGATRIRRANGTRLESLSPAPVRDRIIDALGRRETVGREQWDELRDADTLLAASMLPLGADVSRIPLRELRSERDGRDGTQAATLRAMVGERRCDELVLLMAAEPNRQTLRDAVYAHAQLVDQFPSVPGPDDDAGAAPARRSAVSVAPPRQ
ncbi:hypothetical protein [Nocardia veterana]|uniref:Uncharacterized protein n=1 Tax=Nocardia veterana TaxID=132249 RepID=A0A7X6LZ69_9NOCA|nr:hypothetical protein [Nocardia veterana]NKY87236.1 hypothetical protein [Nocardia veterana]